jgi:hypothetical protein
LAPTPIATESSAAAGEARVPGERADGIAQILDQSVHRASGTALEPVKKHDV